MWPQFAGSRGVTWQDMEEVQAYVHLRPINPNVLTRQHEPSMNNDDEMHYLWTIKSDISKEDIHVLVDFEPVQSQAFSDVQHTHVSPNALYDYTSSKAFLDKGSGEQINDLIESGTIRFLDWNDAMIDLQLEMSFVDKTQAISAVQKWYIRIGREFRVVKSKSDQ
ncbi:hypothetical protein M9H77_02852 [Catharanthus roseus]|uniref:Uncharacterized protein n=1 Tax=Catharanthus roseus TaxID=4058 RepID=A0ACC0C9Q5_CATRO|nr:hypothetical protein M9H77_02852 [Catharanthus roseus]